MAVETDHRPVLLGTGLMKGMQERIWRAVKRGPKSLYSEVSWAEWSSKKEGSFTFTAAKATVAWRGNYSVTMAAASTASSAPNTGTEKCPLAMALTSCD